MKKILFTLFACFILVTANAQTENKESEIFYATTMGIGLPISIPSSIPFTWQILGIYNLTERWLVGTGTGLSFYEKMLIPVFGDVRFQIGQTRKFTPYAEFGVGYAFAPHSDAKGGFFMNPSIGMQYPLKNRMRLQLAVGYELQKLERLKTQTDGYFRKEFTEKMSLHSIAIKLGFLF